MAGIAMQMATLVLRSEERMDRTNRMIAAMANHEGWIEEKYIQHIDSLERRLGEVMEENDRLLRIVADMRGESMRGCCQCTTGSHTPGRRGQTLI